MSLSRLRRTLPFSDVFFPFRSITSPPLIHLPSSITLVTPTAPTAPSIQFPPPVLTSSLIHSLVTGQTFDELFRDHFNQSITDEFSFIIPDDMKPPAGTNDAVIYVDARHLDHSWRYVRLGSVGLSRDGRVLFAETCVIDCETLVPNYKPKTFDTVYAEISGFIFGTLLAIEFGIKSYDVITDARAVQDHLKKAYNDSYARDSLRFLTISAKKLWFDHNSQAVTGKVSWVSKFDNIADPLTRDATGPEDEEGFIAWLRFGMGFYNYEAFTQAILAEEDTTIYVKKGDYFDYHVRRNVIEKILPPI